MSKRKFCHHCNKALSACICAFISVLDNRYFLHILQDPSEQKKAIGTARILDLSLTKVKLTVAEVFEAESFDLSNTFLVFPDETSELIDSSSVKQRININTQFIILDGSWKKVHKLLMTNPFLQKLPKVNFNIFEKSNYLIRKSPREDGLSTVEAGYYLLSALENDTEKFIPLLNAFTQMINFQIKQIPENVYLKNYGGTVLQAKQGKH
jgi:DTW domain-containing protein YfiP